MLKEQNLLSMVQKIFLHLVTALIHLLNLLNLKLKDLLTNTNSLLQIVIQACQLHWEQIFYAHLEPQKLIDI